MGKLSVWRTISLVCVFFAVAAIDSPAQTFTTFNAPGAGAAALQGTIPLSINTAGEITGIYIVAMNAAHGFVRAADGTMITFDAPGAGTGLNQGTFPVSINDAGEIAGMYFDKNNVYHGFLRAANGRITEFDVPGAGTTGHRGTNPTSIDTAGDITGSYTDAGGVHHGFLRTAGGAITTFDAPGAGTGREQGTTPGSINALGEITGYYKDAKGVYHGFVRAAGGSITTFNAPGAGTGFGEGTAGVSINAAGEITGSYSSTSPVEPKVFLTGLTGHGFVRAANGSITTFDAPGASTSAGLLRGTIAGRINTTGEVAGFYSDSSGVLHGFVRATDFIITGFEAPGAGTAGTSLIPGTAGVSINDSGDVTGAYADAKGVFHGFVRTPPGAATSTSVVSSLNPSTFGTAVTFTATVVNNGGTPTGTVTFKDGTSTLGTGTLSGGKATFKTSALAGGTHSITAVHPGSAGFSGSISPILTQTVHKANSSTAVVSSLNPSTVGTAVTFTATVKSSTAGTPTGMVTFKDGSTTLGTGTLSGGKATFKTSTLAKGTHPITAVYGGSINFNGSTSVVLNQVVK